MALLCAAVACSNGQDFKLALRNLPSKGSDTFTTFLTIAHQQLLFLHFFALLFVLKWLIVTLIRQLLTSFTSI